MARARLPGTVLPRRSTLDRHPGYVNAIGMASVEVANLEFMLGELLGALLHIDRDFGAIIYLTPQSYAARIAILENIAPYSLELESDVGKQIQSIIERAKRYIGKRHQIIHESWGTKADNPQLVVRRSMPYLEKRPSRAVSLGELTDLIENTRELAEEVVALTTQLFAEWPPYTLKETPPEPQSGAQDSVAPSPQTGQADRPKRKRPPRSSPA
jgi:hypothetical protein